MPLAERVDREAWNFAPIPELVHHIVTKCHLEFRMDLANVETLMEVAALEGGQDDPAVKELREHVARFCGGMRAHLSMEERNLFPLILAWAEGGLPPARLEALASIKKLLVEDHEHEAGLLRTIRTFLSVPVARTGTMGVMAEALKGLAERLQYHFYLENQILFPRAG